MALGIASERFDFGVPPVANVDLYGRCDVNSGLNFIWLALRRPFLVRGDRNAVLDDRRKIDSHT